jgi:hydroxymethylpyrimidine pyrophosphatase-like HAD family hydrolase
MGATLARLLGKTKAAIMSGGAYAQFQKQVLTALPEGTDLHNLYLFPVCAGYCFNYVDNEWKLIDDNSLTNDEKALILKALDEAMAETGFTNPPEQIWGERIEDRGALIAFSGLGQQAPIEEKKKWDPDMNKRRPLAEALIKRLPGFEVKMNATTTIDITRKGITKAYGVQKLSAFTGAAVTDMLYIGDALFPGGNDEVVIPTGIQTRPTDGPEETARLIEELLSHI